MPVLKRCRSAWQFHWTLIYHLLHRKFVLHPIQLLIFRSPGRFLLPIHLSTSCLQHFPVSSIEEYSITASHYMSKIANFSSRYDIYWGLHCWCAWSRKFSAISGSTTFQKSRFYSSFPEVWASIYWMLRVRLWC